MNIPSAPIIGRIKPAKHLQLLIRNVRAFEKLTASSG